MSARRFRPRPLTLADGRMVTLRAAGPADVDEIIQAFGRLSADSRYARFLHHKTVLRPEEVAPGVSPRPGLAFVIVATVPAPDGIDIVGGAQYLPDGVPDSRTCEFAVTVVDGWHGCGLGTRLMRSLIRLARNDGYQAMRGLVLAENRAMLEIARRQGFSVGGSTADPGAVEVRRLLVPAPLQPSASIPRQPA